MKNLFNRFVREESGQDIIEYALLAAFISIVAWSILVTIGSDVKTIYTAVDGVTGSAAGVLSLRGMTGGRLCRPPRFRERTT